MLRVAGKSIVVTPCRLENVWVRPLRVLQFPPLSIQAEVLIYRFLDLARYGLCALPTPLDLEFNDPPPVTPFHLREAQVAGF